MKVYLRECHCSFCMSSQVIGSSIIAFLLFGSFLFAQNGVTLTGKIVEKDNEEPLPYVNVSLNSAADSTMVEGTFTDEDGFFEMEDIRSDKYYLKISSTGFHSIEESVYVGEESDHLNLGKIGLEGSSTELGEVIVSARRDVVGNRMDKKTISADRNITQTGGSMLQALKNLPGITTENDKVKLRGSDKVTILIDGKQSALTGIDGQSGLDDIPASDIDEIEIINNPSAKHEASGSAGVINIITKKESRSGLRGEVGLSAGLGGLWKRKDNYPDVSHQSLRTPKANPSASINYHTEKLNFFVKVDDRYTESQHSNEFTERIYENGEVRNQQFKRDKKANHITGTGGMDWYIDDQNALTIAGSYTNKIKTNDGEQPIFNKDFSERERLWTMTEDDHKNLASATAHYEHQFRESGHLLEANMDFSYTRRHKEYDFVNTLPDAEGTDAFDYVSREHIYNFGIDYTRPLKFGKLETGVKLRYRNIPSDMDFMPGENSVIDEKSGGWSEYRELIPAFYGNYDFETENWVAELGVRVEYMRIKNDVNDEHPVYKNDGYNYFEPFFNAELGYKFNKKNRLSLFYNRRVDRPSDKELRIFPKYDDAEILEVGNPGLIPQFTNEMELGYKKSGEQGYLFSAAYHRIEKNTIQQISTSLPGEDLIYDVFQNAGKSYYTGLEVVLAQEVAGWYDFVINANIYRHQINAFTVENPYPETQLYESDRKTNISGDAKLNNHFHFPKDWKVQLTGIYIAPDKVPQGREGHRFSLDLGIKKQVQKGKGEAYFNASDLLNTMHLKKTVHGHDFDYTVKDYKETQVFRVGYKYKF